MIRPADVTVVIPTRDRWPRLSLTLNSALNQVGITHEVVVVDDASADETPLRLASVQDPRLRVIRHKTVQGVASARNSGLFAARGTWVAFLDDDDLWSPEKLRSQLDAAMAEGAVFVYSAIVLLDEHRHVVGSLPLPDPTQLLPLLLRQQVIPAGASNVMARTHLVRALGGFDTKLQQFADWDLWIRLAAAGRAAVCPQAHVGYVKHSGNMLLGDQEGVWRELEYLARKHQEASRAAGRMFDTIGVARWIAVGYRRAGKRRCAARAYVQGALAQGPLDIRGRAGNLARALAVVLAGERLLRRRATRPPTREPPWLAQYRHAALAPVQRP